jgi:hypothetical protein
MKLALLLVSVAFSAAAFLALDWFCTAAIQRHPKTAVKPNVCRARDPIRDHALRPNCASTDQWGKDSYDYFTNSLGFRDEKIREVPLADARPRILLLGDSFTEGMVAWRNSYVGMIAARFPQYDFLNGGLPGYSPSNYLNTTRIVLAKGFEIDEVIVFMDSSFVPHEGSFYRDVDPSGAVAAHKNQPLPNRSWYTRVRIFIARHFLLVRSILEFCDRFLVAHGYYHLTPGYFGDPFDMEMSAWTYRRVNETDPHPIGYAPLGVEGGIAKAKAKMTLLWQELGERHIPISVVVYPHLPQIVHDSPESRQVRIWREWCEGRCKRFISVFPPFFAARSECPRTQPGCWYQKLFIFGDFHFNAAGNALVADAVIKSLTEASAVKLQESPSPASGPHRSP